MRALLSYLLNMLFLGGTSTTETVSRAAARRSTRGMSSRLLLHNVTVLLDHADAIECSEGFCYSWTKLFFRLWVSDCLFLADLRDPCICADGLSEIQAHPCWVAFCSVYKKRAWRLSRRGSVSRQNKATSEQKSIFVFR